MAENRQQQEAQEGEEQQGNPLDRVLGNDTGTLCKEHCFMIARFVKHHNDLRDDFHADSRSKRKKLEKQKKEIEGLKEKCQHLEEAINHIKNLTESMQAETSTKASQKDQQKDDQMEDTVNQFWC